jgi:hypothetical protein
MSWTATGEFLAGRAYVKQTWARGLDDKGHATLQPSSDQPPGVYSSGRRSRNKPAKLVLLRIYKLQHIRFMSNIPYTAEAHVRGRTIWGVRGTSCNSIAVAIRVVT